MEIREPKQPPLAVRKHHLYGRELLAAVGARDFAHQASALLYYGRAYVWHPQHVVVECDCGERLVLSACETVCSCGVDHTALVREELAFPEGVGRGTAPMGGRVPGVAQEERVPVLGGNLPAGAERRRFGRGVADQPCCPWPNIADLIYDRCPGAL